MKNNYTNQSLILYADASAPQHLAAAGVGCVLTCQLQNFTLATLSKRIALPKSCTLHAELQAIRAGLCLLPRNSEILLRSDSIAALWLLHETETIAYQDVTELCRMTGGKQKRLELRKKQQTERFHGVIEDCKAELATRSLKISSLWIKGHSKNEAHALADRLAASALKERLHAA